MSNLNDPRVLFALERTALAWNRSALALIGFGFLIEKSVVLIHLISADSYQHKVIYSQILAVCMVLLGLVTSVCSILQYRAGLRSLTPDEFIEGYSITHPILLNCLTMVIGVLLLGSFFLI